MCGKWGCKMKKYVIIAICTLIIGCILSACGTIKDEEKKIGELDFEVLTDDNLPKEVEDIVSERKKNEFKTNYTDGKDLYIIIGYGKQATGGYSIRVDELYETKTNIYIGTTFLGPDKNEQVSQTETYPYIVVKVKHMDKSVVFK